jgi:hypothetical protein
MSRHWQCRVWDEEWDRVLADLPRINVRASSMYVAIGDTVACFSNHGSFVGTVVAETTPIRPEFHSAFLLDTPAAACWAVWEEEFSANTHAAAERTDRD